MSFNFYFLTSKVVSKYGILDISIRYPILYYTSIGYRYRNFIQAQSWSYSIWLSLRCGLLSCDSSSICKRCCHVFALHYILEDDLECPMDYELPLHLSRTQNSEWFIQHQQQVTLKLPSLFAAWFHPEVWRVGSHYYNKWENIQFNVLI